MGVKWTEEQQKVIQLRNRNILVSAAAGSGKTAVLVERIITMLTEDDPPVDVDKLLIVTFTEAAASEMKERIRLAIEKKLLEYPEDEHLKQQATLIHNAQITTIHESFWIIFVSSSFSANASFIRITGLRRSSPRINDKSRKIPSFPSSVQYVIPYIPPIVSLNAAIL